jgi:hypothetical protein
VGHREFGNLLIKDCCIAVETHECQMKGLFGDGASRGRNVKGEGEGKAGEIDEETGKLYHINKYLKGQTQTLEQGSQGWGARVADLLRLLLAAELQERET